MAWSWSVVFGIVISLSSASYPVSVLFLLSVLFVLTSLKLFDLELNSS